MASRLKEDEKNERIIRGLIKLPANRRCINCNSLGPQYVCTTFWTFVCTTCSGIHREFTHRVKSVSMAKFTPQEVSTLQSGGNERAKEIYFRELDPHSPVPDSSDVDRLRDFIKHVYVDRRYTGERSSDKPPRVKMGDKEEPYDYRRTDYYGSGPRSPPYEDTYERRYSDQASPGYEGRRSPGYQQDNQRNSDYGRSPVRPGSGVVNDWRREDRFGNGRKSEELRSPEGDSKPGGRSPDSQKDLNASSPPVVRPVRDILGENATPLRVIEPLRVVSVKMSEGSAHTQRTASSNSLVSSNGNPTEIKKVDSLIDFDADPVPAAAAATQPKESTANVTSTANADNWACFDNAPETKVSQPPQSLNTLDSVLTQLSVPSPVPSSGFSTSSGAGAPSNSATTPALVGDSLFGSTAQVSMTLPSGTTPAARPASNALLLTPNGAYAAAPSNTALPTIRGGTSVGNFSSFPAGGAPTTIPGMASAAPKNGVAGHWSNMQPQQQSLYPGSGSHLTVSQNTYSTGASTSQGFSSHPVAQLSQAGIVPAHASLGVAPQPVEVKASGREELPADLFTAMYASQPLHAPRWRTGFPPAMTFPMQYHNAMPMRTFSQPANSVNPFDVGNESSHAQAPAFPSMMPLQNALPNLANPTGLVCTSNLGTVLSPWMPPQASAYPSANPQLTPSFASSAVTPGTYMSHQVPSSMAQRPQGFGGFGNDIASFSTMNPSLGHAGNLSGPASPSPSGNPFG